MLCYQVDEENEQVQELFENKNSYCEKISLKLLYQLKHYDLQNVLIVASFSNIIDLKEYVQFIMEKVKAFLISNFIQNSTRIGPQDLQINMFPKTNQSPLNMSNYSQMKGNAFQNNLSHARRLSNIIDLNLSKIDCSNSLTPLNTTSRSRYNATTKFKDRARLILPSEYETTSNIRPLTTLGSCTQKSPKNVFQCPLNFEITQEQFQEAIVQSQKALKSISRIQIIELKHQAKLSKYLMIIIESLLRLKNNEIPSYSTVYDIIKEEKLKPLLLTFDPQRIQVAIAKNVLSLFQNQSILRLQETEQISQIEKTLTQFIIAICQITIGIQECQYQFSNLINFSQSRQPPENSSQQIQPPIVYETPQQNNYNLQKIDSQTSQEIQEIPKVTISYRGSVSPTMRMFNNTQTPSIMNRRLKSQQRSIVKRPEGTFLKPKHLILTDMKILKPVSKIPPTIPVFNLHEMLPKQIQRQHYDQVEIPDIDLYNYQDVSLAKYLKDAKLVAEERFTQEEIKEKMNQLPSSNHDVMQYVSEIEIQNQPTHALLELAKMMKERRINTYEIKKEQPIANKNTLKKNNHAKK